MNYDLTTEVTAVSVYPDRAQVTRQGQLQIGEPGEHTLRISGLPLNLQRESLRANGTGPAGTLILGVEQETEFHATAPDEARERLRLEIQRIEREIASQEAREELLHEQHGWIRTLAEHTVRSTAGAIARGERQPEDATRVIQWAAEQARAIEDARLEIEHVREENGRQLETLRREYEQAADLRVPDRIAATVRLRVAAPGTITLRLSYLIGGARWLPRYDTRISRERAQVHLTQQALVIQQTGEDWPQVALTLSTARPAAARNLPDDPSPWYIDIQPPFHPLAADATMPRASRMMMRAPAATEALAQPAAMSAYEAMPMESAQIEATGSIRTFRIPGGVDIPSDGMPHVVGLGEYDMECRFEYVAMPAVAEGAHLSARVRNTTGQVLLPGEIHIFRASAAGDEFTGTTHLDLVAEQAEMTLFLGPDDNITIKRELIERDTDKGSLLQRGIRRVTAGYRVTVDNRTGERQHVVLKDRLPVSRNEKIKVNLLEVRPQPTARTKLDQLTWELDLTAGEERQITWRFTVESPGDSEVAGMP